MANGRCRMHGGKSLAGPASPSFRDGRYSKTLPQRLLADALASLNDPDKLALEDELALIDARINDVLSRVDTGESGHLWAELQTSWNAVEKARQAHDRTGLVAALRTHGELVTQSHHDAASWRDVTDLVERRRRLVDSERKRLIAAQQMISADQALAMMGLLVESVRRHVKDDDALRAVTAEFARLTGGPQC